MATKNVVPRADSEGGIGTALKRWLNGFFRHLTVSDDATVGALTANSITADSITADGATIDGALAAGSATVSGALSAGSLTANSATIDGQPVNYNMWKPNTEYQVGNVAYTASLPSQYCLVCTTAGTSGATEPVYTNPEALSFVRDGSVLWNIKTTINPVVAYNTSTVTQSVLSSEWTATASNSGSKGTYLFVATAEFKTSSTTTGSRKIRFVLNYEQNGTTKTKTYIGSSVAGQTTNEYVNASAVIDIPYAETDNAYVDLEVYQNSGAASNVATILTMICLMNEPRS